MHQKEHLRHNWKCLIKVLKQCCILEWWKEHIIQAANKVAQKGILEIISSLQGRVLSDKVAETDEKLWEGMCKILV